jgi:hypothetical protein
MEIFSERRLYFTLLPPEFQTFGETFGQAGGADFLLGGGDVVIEAAEFDRASVGVIDDIAGFRIDPP